MLFRFLIVSPLLLSLMACAQPIKRAAPASHSYSAAQLKNLSNDALCHDIAMHPTTEKVRAEKERRNLDCTASTMAIVESGQAGYLAEAPARENGSPLLQGLAQSIVLMNAAIAQQEQTRPPAPMIRHTNCHKIGNSLNCTSW